MFQRPASPPRRVDPMTGHGSKTGFVAQARRPHGCRPPDRRRDFPVGPRLAVRDGGERLPDLPLEGVPDVERQIELRLARPDGRGSRWSRLERAGITGD
jgi:hypothetical protein